MTHSYSSRTSILAVLFANPEHGQGNFHPIDSAPQGLQAPQRRGLLQAASGDVGVLQSRYDK